MTFKLLENLNRKIIFPLLVLASPLVKADWFALNMTRGITDISNEVFELHMLIFWICVVIGVLVFGVMFYSMWAHTKKKNPVPAKFHENHKLEIAWTIIPFLILIAMAVPASKTLVKIYDDEAGDINIQVTGYQWKWQYRYLEDGVSFFANLSAKLLWVVKSIIFSCLTISLATESISPKLSAKPSLIADSPDQKRPEKVS